MLLVRETRLLGASWWKSAGVEFTKMSRLIAIFIVSEDEDWGGIANDILFLSLYRVRAALSMYT